MSLTRVADVADTLLSATVLVLQLKDVCGLKLLVYAAFSY